MSERDCHRWSSDHRQRPTHRHLLGFFAAAVGVLAEKAVPRHHACCGAGAHLFERSSFSHQNEKMKSRKFKDRGRFSDFDLYYFSHTLNLLVMCVVWVDESWLMERSPFFREFLLGLWWWEVKIGFPLTDRLRHKRGLCGGAFESLWWLLRYIVCHGKQRYRALISLVATRWLCNHGFCWPPLPFPRLQQSLLEFLPLFSLLPSLFSLFALLALAAILQQCSLESVDGCEAIGSLSGRA